MREDQGRVAIVTGAGKGLGAAFARALAATGARVVVNNRARRGQPSSAEAVCAAICAAGGEAVAELSDITDADAPAAILARALESFGRIDAVILNAGISGPVARVEATTAADLRGVMETNFFATAALAQAALPHLLASDAGRLVFVSSSSGLHGLRGRAPYAASKGAINGFALSLADEVRRTPLRVNILCPYAATPMTAAEIGAGDPLLSPDRAAAMAVFLASAQCGLNGEIHLAGARRYRRARTLEAAGASAPTDDPAWIAAHLGAIADMTGAREFTGAQAAFADLYADARASE